MSIRDSQRWPIDWSSLYWSECLGSEVQCVDSGLHCELHPRPHTGLLVQTPRTSCTAWGNLSIPICDCQRLPAIAFDCLRFATLTRWTLAESIRFFKSLKIIFRILIFLSSYFRFQSHRMPSCTSENSNSAALSSSWSGIVLDWPRSPQSGAEQCENTLSAWARRKPLKGDHFALFHFDRKLMANVSSAWSWNNFASSRKFYLNTHWIMKEPLAAVGDRGSPSSVRLWQN